MSFGSMLSKILNEPEKISEALYQDTFLHCLCFWALKVVGLFIKESSVGGKFGSSKGLEP